MLINRPEYENMTHKVYLKDYAFVGSEAVSYQWNSREMQWFFTSHFEPTNIVFK